MNGDATHIRMAVRKFAPFESAMHKLWEAFCRDTGCRLTLEAVPMDLAELHDAVLVTEGLKKGRWDIAHLSTDWIADAIHRGAVSDLAPLIDASPPEGYPAAWPEALLGLQRRGDGIFGLPFHDGPECLIYRNDLFEAPALKTAFEQQTGRPLAPPDTWEEFAETAEFFNGLDKGLAGALVAAFPDGHNAVFDFCIQLWSRGGELTGPQGGMVLDSPEAAAAVNFYRRLLGAGGILPSACHGYDSVAAGEAFSRGEAAMMVNWFGFAALAQIDPDSYVRGKVDVCRLPAGVPGKSVALSSYWLYTVGAGSAHIPAAYEFLRYALTPQGDKLVTTEGGIGCRISTWQDKDINRDIPFFHKLESLHHHARSLPSLARWPAIAGLIDKVMMEAIHTETPAGDILKAAQQEISAYTDNDTN